MLTSRSSSLPPDLQYTMQMVLEYRQGGRPAEATVLCRQMLGRYPRQPDVLGLLGELLMSQGDCDAALPLLDEARQIAPGNPQHWLMLTQCLLAVDRPKEAKKVISEAIAKGLRHPLADELLRLARSGKKKSPEKSVPLGELLRQLETLLQAGHYPEAEKLGRDVQRHYAKSAQAGYCVGMAVLFQGRPAEAAPLLTRAVELDPAMAPAHYNLGFALESLERWDEALAAYRRAVAVAPQMADAHNNLGNMLQKLGHYEEALAAFERACALRQEDAAFHMNRGNALGSLECLEDARLAYETALKLNPALLDGYVRLALVLSRLERYEDIVPLLGRAIEQSPGLADAHQSLGYALRKLRRYDDAVEAYRRAVELRPEDAQLHTDLGVALKEAGQYQGALAALRRALELRPDFESALSLMGGTLLDMGYVAEAIETYRRGLVLNPDAFYLDSALLLSLNYQSDTTPAALLDAARAFGERAARKAVPFTRHENAPDPERRLRIGLVSGDLGDHPVGFFLRGVLERLDSNRLETFVYETAARKGTLNEFFRRLVSHWLDAKVVNQLDDEALAKQIRSDTIDVLVDLSGHTAQSRLPVFAWKPAPVQVSWLGYLGTTGLDTMDYVLADDWALPAGEEVQFTETPWRLPKTYICFSPPDLPVECNALPALDKGHMTFGCFNNLNKIDDRVVSCWAELLHAVPGARLYLKTKTLGASEVRERLLARFARCGVAADRLILDGQFANHEAHFRAYHQVDIALDPFPYPGITTTMEALWMGAPVLTMRGDRFISHQGETILHNAGLPEWIAADTDDYVEKAAAFARDTKTLAALRAGLRGRLLASPLCDAPRFARNLEEALRRMWWNWCEQKQAPGQAC